MGDEGRPEDSEVERLRNQLTAAEQVAALRAELEAAERRLEEAASTDRLSRKTKMPTQRQGARWLFISVVILVAGLAAISVFLINGPEGDPTQLSPETTSASMLLVTEKQTKAALSNNAVRDLNPPTLILDCPPPRTSNAESIRITIGAEWTWSTQAGFSSLSVFYGDGRSSGRLTGKGPDAFTNALQYQYTKPGRYTIDAALTDGRGVVVRDRCQFLWKPDEAALQADQEKALKVRYIFNENSSRVRELQRAIKSVTNASIAVDGVYGPGTRNAHLRALSELGLSTASVPVIPRKAASPTTTRAPAKAWTKNTTTTAPRTKTTTAPTPAYRIPTTSADGKPMRWNPCTVPINIMLSSAHYLDPVTRSEWDKTLLETATEISIMSGLTVRYGGLTNELPVTQAFVGDTYTTQILIYVAPYGTGWLESAGEDRRFHLWYQALPGSTWNRTDRFDIHLNPNYLSEWSSIRHRVMLRYLVGSAFLNSPTKWNSQEIMSMTPGKGSAEKPMWGDGDKIGFQEVGAIQGCLW